MKTMSTLRRQKILISGNGKTSSSLMGKFVSSVLLSLRVTCAGGHCSAWAHRLATLMTVMFISVRLLSIPGRRGHDGIHGSVQNHVDSEPDLDFVKTVKTGVCMEVVLTEIVVEIKNVNGHHGKSGLNVLRSVEEVQGAELGNVRKKTNVPMETGLR